MVDLENIQIRSVDSSSDEQSVVARQLFRDYAAEIQVDLSFQNFEEELAELPGEYGPPSGRLFILFFENHPAGCVAIRRLGANACEMKRLYIRPDYRGKGIGRQLAETAVSAARRIGYEAIYLDTLPTMSAAVELYGSLGFQEILAYYDSPIPGTRFMRLDLV
ncbi:MAG: GNAT family N-acetyltransferase [Candidatus Binataceae bacterium]